MPARLRRTEIAALFLMVLIAVLASLAGPAARILSPSVTGSSLSAAGEMVDLLDAAKFAVGDEAVDGAALHRFYQSRDSRLAWSGNRKANADAKVALQVLSGAEEHGLPMSSYHLNALREFEESAGAHDTAVYDLLLTDGMLRYARDVRTGRIPPRSAYSDVNLPDQMFDPVPVLGAALQTGSLAAFLAELPPLHPEYERLKTALVQYRRLVAEGAWSQLSATSADTERLLARLSKEDSAALDGNVIEALRRYQSRNGLEPDGKLGPRTLAMLNVPASDRVAQIEANMERWRWLPRELESRYVMINAADATLKVVADGETILSSKVIVGARDKPTPMFRAIATEVTVNPPWNIPSSIARNEILPLLRRDPGYLRSQHIVLLNGPKDDPYGARIDWKRISAKAFPYQLQQLPGADNALGALKLEMPNAFNVYLHDTPGKNAFTRNDRNLSHGCVRVEQILPLASVALDGDA